MTFGRSISKDLQEAGVEIDGWYWYEVAQNRALWREVVRHLAPPDETKNNDPHNQATTAIPPFARMLSLSSGLSSEP